MNIVQFIEGSLSWSRERTLRSVSGLSQKSLEWRPSSQANSIGTLLWHLGASEDRYIQAAVLKRLPLWERGEWYKRFNYPKELSAGIDPARRDNLPVPALAHLLSYLGAVRGETLAFVRGLNPRRLEVVPDPQRPDRNIGSILRLMVYHESHHQGQMDYLRGLLEPGWDATQPAPSRP